MTQELLALVDREIEAAEYPDDELAPYYHDMETFDERH